MRVKRAVHANKKKSTYFKNAKGYQGSRRNLIRHVKEAVERGWVYAYRDRKVRKRDFRRLWIVRINSAVREYGLSYSEFIHGLKVKGIEMDRKTLANLCMNNNEAFKSIVDLVKA